MEANESRACGSCGEKRIPRGVDWPLWRDGKPVCIKCHILTVQVPSTLPPCPACGGICGITPFKTVSCVDCPYDAGGSNDTEDDAKRMHLLHCQRIAMLVPVVPAGWKLVPMKLTPEMRLADDLAVGLDAAWIRLLDAAPEYAPDYAHEIAEPKTDPA